MEGNKSLVRRYIQAIDDNRSSDWSVLDDFIVEARNGKIAEDWSVTDVAGVLQQLGVIPGSGG